MVLINKNAKLLPYKRNDNANVGDANVRHVCVGKMQKKYFEVRSKTGYNYDYYILLIITTHF